MFENILNRNRLGENFSLLSKCQKGIVLKWREVRWLCRIVTELRSLMLSISVLSVVPHVAGQFQRSRNGHFRLTSAVDIRCNFWSIWWISWQYIAALFETELWVRSLLYVPSKLRLKNLYHSCDFYVCIHRSLANCFRSPNRLYNFLLAELWFLECLGFSFRLPSTSISHNASCLLPK